MNHETCPAHDRQMTSIFEKYLTVWVGLCIVAGILLGEIAPGLAKTLKIWGSPGLGVGTDLSVSEEILLGCPRIAAVGSAHLGCGIIPALEP